STRSSVPSCAACPSAIAGRFIPRRAIHLWSYVPSSRPSCSIELLSFRYAVRRGAEATNHTFGDSIARSVEVLDVPLQRANGQTGQRANGATRRRARAPDSVIPVRSGGRTISDLVGKSLSAIATSDM